MKKLSIAIGFISIGLVLFLFLEIGIFNRVTDARCIVEDGVVGGSHWIVKVDGKEVDRVKHGTFVTRVPLALVEPGKRELTLKKDFQSDKGRELTKNFTFEEGKRYRLVLDSGEIRIVETN